MKIPRDEQRQFGKDIIDRYKHEPKLFYRYVNSKLKSKVSIGKLLVDGVVYEDLKEMAEVMNKSFKEVFTKEKEFIRPLCTPKNGKIEEFQVTKEEIDEIIKKLDERKATGLDSVGMANERMQ